MHDVKSLDECERLEKRIEELDQKIRALPRSRQQDEIKKELHKLRLEYSKKCLPKQM